MANRPVGVVLCRYSDLPNVTPRPQRFYEEFFTELGRGLGGAFDYWNDVTYGGVFCAGSQVFPWIDLGHTTTDRNALQFPGGRATIAGWGAEAAARAAISLAPFSAVIFVLNDPTDHGAAGGNRMLLGYGPGDWEPTFVFHEMGHCFGLDHSWRAQPDTVYGDRWDIMSAMNVGTFVSQMGTPAGPGLTVWNLRRLASFPELRALRLKRHNVRQVVRLAALSEPWAVGRLSIDLPPGGIGRCQPYGYTVELRVRSGWDKGIDANAVLVHEIRGGNSYLLPPPLTFVNDSVSAANGLFSVQLISLDAASATADVEVLLYPLKLGTGAAP